MNTHGTSSLLGRREAASRLACSLATLDRLVRSGALKVVYLDRRPRFRSDDLEALVRARSVVGREA
jgi:excisionase family DNA binding protein